MATVKVLFPFVGDTVGGSHHSAALLMRALPALGILPVPLIHRPGPLRGFLLDQGLEVIGPTNLPVWEAGRGIFSNVGCLAALTPAIWSSLRRHQVDIVHVNDGRTRATWAVATKLSGIPLISHQRNKLEKSRISLFALSLSDRIVAISEYVRSTVPNRLLQRTCVVTNPFLVKEVVDRRQARLDLESEFDIDAKNYIITVVGTVVQQKRPLIALNVLAILRRMGFSAVLLFVGRIEGAELASVIDAIVQMELKDHVRLIGYRPDIKKFISGCDLLLAPAINEGHGRVLVEAMVAGTPVIASNAGGHIEIVQHDVNGILVEPDNADAMATATAKFLTDSGRASQLANRAREDAALRFGVEAHAHSMATIYQSVLEQR
jgi:glycosyltransferase involved in cell wall biosynthesis